MKYDIEYYSFNKTEDASDMEGYCYIYQSIRKHFIKWHINIEEEERMLKMLEIPYKKIKNYEANRKTSL